jgi:hypothetical protein
MEYDVRIIEEIRKHGKEKPIEYIADENGCWNCISHKLDKDGYPKVVRGNRHWQMNRYIYTLAKGDIPKGMYILHSCDNPNCINPDHLRAGTHQENMIEMVLRGRKKTKLTDDEVRAIRKAEGTHDEIAAKYGVSQPLVTLIKNNKARKYVI